MFVTLRMRRPTKSTLFPYTTLFRSELGGARQPPRQLLVDPDVAAPQLRELEVRVGEREREGRRRRTVDRTSRDRKSTRLNSSHQIISYAVFCLKKKIKYKFNFKQSE